MGENPPEGQDNEIHVCETWGEFVEYIFGEVILRAEGVFNPPFMYKGKDDGEFLPEGYSILSTCNPGGRSRLFTLKHQNKEPNQRSWYDPEPFEHFVSYTTPRDGSAPGILFDLDNLWELTNVTKEAMRTCYGEHTDTGGQVSDILGT